MKEGFSLECFVKDSISCALEIACNNPNFLDYEKEFYNNLSSKTGLDENQIRYLSNPIYWELFCNFNNPILMLEDLNLDSINKKILYHLKSLKKRNGKCFSFEDIIEKTDAIFKLRMENTKVSLNGSKKSVYEIRSVILEKNRDYFEARLKILGIN